MKANPINNLALALMSSLFAVSAYAATKITAVPFTITKAGTYIFVGNLTLSGASPTAITVNASGVLIDLKGFTLATATNDFGVGISVSSTVIDVTIQNGSIESFAAGVQLSGPQGTVQNIRLEGPGDGVAVLNNSSVVQNCFIVGTGTGTGVFAQPGQNALVTNNRVINFGVGALSGGNNSFIANYIASCTTGLQMAAGDKYAANVTNSCTTPFSGGTPVGNANN